MMFHFRSRLSLPVCILTLVLFFLLLRSNRDLVSVRGFGSGSPSQQDISKSEQSDSSKMFFRPVYQGGIAKPAGQNYSRTVVIASLKLEDTSWLAQLDNDPNLSTAIYVVDDANATYTVPKNKGHEVMVYLTYIIDHYDQLSDVTMFMHGHRISWHNNDLLSSDAVEMIQRLSSPTVSRGGYMNMRCHLEPGCPNHIHPSTDDDHDGNVPEAVVIGRAWLELFPETKAPPAVLSQPCCAQFAVSKERIRTLPLEQYIFFRKWLLDTDLDDRLSGRVWEYVWQYIFGGSPEHCPRESTCYCDGYGICFGGEDQYQDWFAMRRKSRELANLKNSLGDEERDSQRKVKIQVDMAALDIKMGIKVKEAFSRGEDPKIRALEAGREWKEGDGF